MNFRFILSFLCTVLCLGFGLNTFAGANDPETRVEISIYDLIPRPKISKKKAAQLPAGYGDAVAAVISGAKSKLIDCLETIQTPSSTYMVLLLIDASGNAQLKTEGSAPIPECISQTLTTLQYPTHTLPQAVTIRLPLKLSRKQK